MADRDLKIELGAHQQAILERQIELGHYEDATQVVNDALSQMGERQAEFDDRLREEVRASLADPSPPIPMDEVFKRVRTHISRTARGAKRGA
jgi:Arc/MetJ-type ribon-helix-helix transcriptional regulator